MMLNSLLVVLLAGIAAVQTATKKQKVYDYPPLANYPPYPSDYPPNADYPPYADYPPVGSPPMDSLPVSDYPPVYGGPPPEASTPPPGESMPPPGESMPPPGESMPPPEESMPPPEDTMPPPYVEKAEPATAGSMHCTLTMYDGYDFTGNEVTYGVTFTSAATAFSQQNFATFPESTWKLDDKIVALKLVCDGDAAQQKAVTLRMFDWPYYKIIKDSANGATIKWTDYTVGNVANMNTKANARKASAFCIFTTADCAVSTSTPKAIVEDVTM